MAQIILALDNMDMVAAYVLHMLKDKDLCTTHLRFGQKPIVHKKDKLKDDLGCENISPVKKFDEGKGIFCIRITYEGGCCYSYPGTKVIITENKVTFEDTMDGNPNIRVFTVV